MTEQDRARLERIVSSGEDDRAVFDAVVSPVGWSEPVATTQPRHRRKKR